MLKSTWTKLRANRTTRLLAAVVALLAVVMCLSGCETFRFYRQAIGGQYELFAKQEPIVKLLADPKTPRRLQEKLQLVQDLRRFARDELKLPVGRHYEKYVDLHRSFVVWNVEAAPEFSMEPKSWWYPLVGRLEYRGYFAKDHAQRYGEKLAKNGYDVHLGGASAYSTLGWFKDPVLNTFIFEHEAGLAETLFHELGHQQVFARGDTDFNEAFATTVGQEGARRWLQSHGSPAAQKAYEIQIRHTREFVRLVMAGRLRLEQLYGDERNSEGKIRAARSHPKASETQLRAEKSRVLRGLRDDYAKLRTNWDGDDTYAAYFSHDLNNSKLNSVAAYYDLVPGFERLLEINKGDLMEFYRAADRLSTKTKTHRHQFLRTLAKAQESNP
jgi:predicted aminopeptidase